MLLCAMDPGLKGGVVVIQGNRLIEANALPLGASGSGAIDVCQLFELIKMADHAVIEIPIPVAVNSGGSLATSFTNYGRMLAAIEIRQIPYTVLQPNMIRKTMGARANASKKEWGKDQTAEWVFKQRPDWLFATIKKGKRHDGILDACAIGLVYQMLAGERRVSP